jgi:flagellar FliJ protein
LKRFHFELEKLLAIRAHKEREAEIELGRAVGALTLLEGRISALAAERLRAASSRYAHGFGVPDMVSSDRYIQRLDADKERLIKEAAQAELKVEEARRLYVEASRERKILDKLKERRERDYRRFVLGEETKTVDDISSGSRARSAAVQG